MALGIQQAQEEMRSYYILGYYTTNTAEDGKFRKISVKLNNQFVGEAGTSATGYYAQGVGQVQRAGKGAAVEGGAVGGRSDDRLAAGAAGRLLPRFADGVLRAGFGESAGLGGGAGGKGRARAQTQFDFVGQIQDERSAWWATCATTSESSWTRMTRQAGAAELPIRCRLHAGAGQIPHEVPGARKPVGKMGTFETRFTVPDLSADTIGLKAEFGDLEQPARAAEGGGGRGGKTSAKGWRSNPLVAGRGESGAQHHQGVPAQPEPLRHFDVYDAAPDPADARARRVKVSMSLFNQKGAKAFEAGPLTPRNWRTRVRKPCR